MEEITNLIADLIKSGIEKKAEERTKEELAKIKAVDVLVSQFEKGTYKYIEGTELMKALNSDGNIGVTQTLRPAEHRPSGWAKIATK